MLPRLTLTRVPPGRSFLNCHKKSFQDVLFSHQNSFVWLWVKRNPTLCFMSPLLLLEKNLCHSRIHHTHPQARLHSYMSPQSSKPHTPSRSLRVSHSRAPLRCPSAHSNWLYLSLSPILILSCFVGGFQEKWSSPSSPSQHHRVVTACSPSWEMGLLLHVWSTALFFLSQLVCPVIFLENCHGHGWPPLSS